MIHPWPSFRRFWGTILVPLFIPVVIGMLVWKAIQAIELRRDIAQYEGRAVSFWLWTALYPLTAGVVITAVIVLFR